MRVVCTAGHVDHGKTTLVGALTGQQPDRLAEEKRRGLTIEAGFAWTRIEGLGDLALVDLPGHERFVTNMLSGAGPVSAALFVVAADEGWSRQSEEHLAILDLLQVSVGVAAVTRTDLVDAETAEIAAEMVAEHLNGSSLAGIPVVGVSAVTGQGLPELRRALVEQLQTAPTPQDVGRPRLWIDRAFTVRGAGTVVTGTLQGGRIAVADQVWLQPTDRPTRVRGVQSLGQPVDSADPGARVALNLVGVDVDEVDRGQAVTGAHWRSTDEATLWARPLPGHELERTGAWTLHVGSAAVSAALYPLSGAPLSEPGFLRVELASALPLVASDRVVLRESGRGTTVGGGVGVDPAPPPRVRGAAARQARLTALRDVGTEATAGAALADPSERVARLVGLRGVATRAKVLADAWADEAAIGDAVRNAGVVDLGSHLCAPEPWRVWSSLAVQAVVKVHQSRPALSVVDRAAPRRRLAEAECPAEVVDVVVDHLVTAGRLDTRPGGVAAPGHEPRLSVAQQVARAALLAALEQAAFEPPPLEELKQATGADDDLVAALVEDGQIVDLPGLDAVTTPQVLSHAADALRRASPGEAFTTSQARQTLGTSRKYALPLLETMDELGLTTFDGDRRTLVDATGSGDLGGGLDLHGDTQRQGGDANR